MFSSVVKWNDVGTKLRVTFETAKFILKSVAFDFLNLNFVLNILQHERLHRHVRRRNRHGDRRLRGLLQLRASPDLGLDHQLSTKLRNVGRKVRLYRRKSVRRHDGVTGFGKVKNLKNVEIIVLIVKLFVTGSE